MTDMQESLLALLFVIACLTYVLYLSRNGGDPNYRGPDIHQH